MYAGYDTHTFSVQIGETISDVFYFYLKIREAIEFLISRDVLINLNLLSKVVMT